VQNSTDSFYKVRALLQELLRRNFTTKELVPERKRKFAKTAPSEVLRKTLTTHTHNLDQILLAEMNELPEEEQLLIKFPISAKNLPLLTPLAVFIHETRHREELEIALEAEKQKNQTLEKKMEEFEKNLLQLQGEFRGLSKKLDEEETKRVNQIYSYFSYIKKNPQQFRLRMQMSIWPMRCISSPSNWKG